MKYCPCVGDPALESIGLAFPVSNSFCLCVIEVNCTWHLLRLNGNAKHFSIHKHKETVWHDIDNITLFPCSSRVDWHYPKLVLGNFQTRKPTYLSRDISGYIKQAGRQGQGFLWGHIYVYVCSSTGVDFGLQTRQCLVYIKLLRSCKIHDQRFMNTLPLVVFGRQLY